ncbi:MAG: hypothetical protein ABIH28_03805 [archaeon]
MVNEDILGGIEIAVAKGEPVESVMMSLYNSGYPKEDIEWAAKAFQLNKFRPVPLGFLQRQGNSPLFSPKEQSTTGEHSNSSFAKKPEVKQNVSNYGGASQFKEKAILFVLIFSLILLSGILIGVFLFKDSLVDFINSFFS